MSYWQHPGEAPPIIRRAYEGAGDTEPDRPHLPRARGSYQCRTVSEERQRLSSARQELRVAYRLLVAGYVLLLVLLVCLAVMVRDQGRAALARPVERSTR